MIGRRALLLALASSPAAAACGSTEDGWAPMETLGPCVVTARLAGREVRMVLDTGAERSVLTRSAVTRLGLPLDEWVGSTLRGAGGRLDEHRNAIVPDLSLGRWPLFQRAPGQRLSLPVMALDLGPIVGLIGGDLLLRHTLDLDAPSGRFALRPPSGCLPPGGNLVALSLLRRSSLLAPVMLDGKSLTALIDTGAAVSLVNARGLYRLGLSPEAIGRDPQVSAIGLGGSFVGRQHRFGNLQVGRLQIEAPRLLVETVPEPAFDMVLGMDILGRQRIVISYESKKAVLL